MSKNAFTVVDIRNGKRESQFTEQRALASHSHSPVTAKRTCMKSRQRAKFETRKRLKRVETIGMFAFGVGYNAKIVPKTLASCIPVCFPFHRTVMPSKMQTVAAWK
jgi:hypothetical protein